MKHTHLVTFDAAQIENIIDKVVPLVAGKDDHEFFRGVLHCKAESCQSSAEFTCFIQKLLDTAAGAAA